MAGGHATPSRTGRAGGAARRGARAPAYRMAGLCLWATGGRVRNRAGRTLFVDRTDRRARQLLLRRGAADRDAVRLWRAAVAAIRPTAVLDVGANYGEVVLSTGYPAGCRVLCVEASRDVAGYLARSLAAGLPGAELTVAAACDRPGVPYLLRPGASSGEGRAVPAGRFGSDLHTVTCDGLLGDVTGGRLVFKVDVEGDEPAVLSGLGRALGTASAACGLVEYFHLDRDTQLRLLVEHELYAVFPDAHGLLRLTTRTLPAIFPAPHRVRPGYAKDVIVAAGDAADLLTAATRREGAGGG
ncbi:MAG TPA: hypothetical protein VFX70_03315 [Mycobacteriales bacterium]|nr:hypothetical protein [Mycobacteriales bacterium]